jgi:pimeloyl-ACP methyl ester carboxylesterase
VEAFVAAMGLDRFTLLGLSMGGICAYGYAARHPERLERLVIVDIAPVLEEEGRTRIMTGLTAPMSFADPEEAVTAARAANPRPPEDALRHRVLHNLKQDADGRWVFRWDPKLRDMPRGPQPDPEAVWASLRNITCPTLVVRGAESDLLGRGSAERMAREIPDCRVVEVEGAGHSVPLDRPEGFLKAVGSFLAG